MFNATKLYARHFIIKILLKALMQSRNKSYLATKVNQQPE